MGKIIPSFLIPDIQTQKLEKHPLPQCPGYLPFLCIHSAHTVAEIIESENLDF